MSELALVLGKIDSEMVSSVEWRRHMGVLTIEFQVDHFACAVFECDL